MRPESLVDAIALLEAYGAGARILNGGTDLMVRVQKMQIVPEAIVDIKRVRDISNSIEWDDGYIKIGARVVMTHLTRDEKIQRRYPALVDAASTVGSIQIRNRATIAGNICNASPAADTVPPLLVHGSTVTLAGPSGTREVPLEEFFLGPGRTARKPAELLVSVTIPVPEGPFGAAFGRLTRRHGVDLASINMACGIDAAGTATFAFGAVGPTPIMARDESGALANPEISDSERDNALRALIAHTRPITDVRASAEYRSAMLLVIGRRVHAQALQRFVECSGRER